MYVRDAEQSSLQWKWSHHRYGFRERRCTRRQHPRCDSDGITVTTAMHEYEGVFAVSERTPPEFSLLLKFLHGGKEHCRVGIRLMRAMISIQPSSRMHFKLLLKQVADF